MSQGRVQIAYEQLLNARGYQADAAQLSAVERLQTLSDELDEFRQARSNSFKRLINRPDVPRGVWLHGGVGRGKSFLMDCFYDSLLVRRKIRVHFYEFMRSIHRELEGLKGQANPLDAVAKIVAKRYRLICFDEFHVSDIADAMILERLLRGLFDQGVCFVMTSNYQPDQLYPDGLHRDRILPAIALLNSHLDVVKVDAGNDYRRSTLEQAQIYITPNDASATASLSRSFEQLAERADQQADLLIEHRTIKALRRAGGVVWFDFATLCDGPRSQNDYLEIAQRFHTVVLSDVPQMTPAMSSQARRFTWLIDVFYDQRVKLFMSAQVPADLLYLNGAMAHEFHRTVSRIVEMQSSQYLSMPKRLAGSS